MTPVVIEYYRFRFVLVYVVDIGKTPPRTRRTSASRFYRLWIMLIEGSTHQLHHMVSFRPRLHLQLISAIGARPCYQATGLCVRMSVVVEPVSRTGGYSYARERRRCEPLEGGLRGFVPSLRPPIDSLTPSLKYKNLVAVFTNLETHISESDHDPSVSP